jgi:hypothetical protein
MPREGEGVDHQREAEQVAVQVEGVFEVTDDALSVIASRIQAREVGIGARDGAKVRGTVEPLPRVLIVAMESSVISPPPNSGGRRY